MVLPCYTIQMLTVPAAFQTESQSFAQIIGDQEAAEIFFFGSMILGSTYRNPQKDHDKKQQTNPATIMFAPEKETPPQFSHFSPCPQSSKCLQNEWEPNIRAIATPQKMQKSSCKNSSTLLLNLSFWSYQTGQHVSGDCPKFSPGFVHHFLLSNIERHHHDPSRIVPIAHVTSSWHTPCLEVVLVT